MNDGIDGYVELDGYNLLEWSDAACAMCVAIIG